jgi:hypothetical protein
MKTTTKTLLSFLISFSATAAFAGAHTWDVWEIFSNADGTIQFVELREANGTAFETGIGGHPVIANPVRQDATNPGKRSVADLEQVIPDCDAGIRGASRRAHAESQSSPPIPFLGSCPPTPR